MNTEKSIFSFKENTLSDKKMRVIVGGRIDPPPPPPILNTTQAAQSTPNGGGVGNDHTNYGPITTPS